MALGATGGDEDEPATFLQSRGSQATQIITLSRLGASGASAKGPRLDVRTSRRRQKRSGSVVYLAQLPEEQLMNPLDFTKS